MINALILAAGTSSRYGESNKLLEPINGSPMIVQTIRRYEASNCDKIYVVVGHEASRLKQLLRDESVRLIENPDYERGQSTSLRAGLTTMDRRGVNGIIIGLGDMPFVTVHTINLLISRFTMESGEIVAPEYDGQRGNPVLFDRQHLDDLKSVSGDRGGKKILKESDDLIRVAVDDPGVLRDIDRPSDFD